MACDFLRDKHFLQAACGARPNTWLQLRRNDKSLIAAYSLKRAFSWRRCGPCLAVLRQRLLGNSPASLSRQIASSLAQYCRLLKIVFIQNGLRLVQYLLSLIRSI